MEKFAAVCQIALPVPYWHICLAKQQDFSQIYYHLKAQIKNKKNQLKSPMTKHYWTRNVRKVAQKNQ